jgi:hypothetical protein
MIIAIRILFDDMDGKFTLFKKIKNLTYSVQLLNDYPKISGRRSEALNKRAFELRKGNRETKTRIVSKSLKTEKWEIVS